jgi:hypothetical protein
MGEKVTSPNNSLRLLLLGIDDSSALSFASLDTPAVQINHQISQHGLGFACFAPCFVSCYLPRNNHGYQRHTGSQPLLPPALRASHPRKQPRVHAQRQPRSVRVRSSLPL